jgi:predicted transcriptional regulator of viral defense system
MPHHQATTTCEETRRSPVSLDETNARRYFYYVKPDAHKTPIRRFVTGLPVRGRYHFTTDEVIEATGASRAAVGAVLRRLQQEGFVAMPFRGFHVVVPPEYRRLGCLPPAQFVPHLTAHLGLDYYVGLLSAAELLGAAHQKPQAFQVVVEHNRPPLSCGEVRVEFVARRNVAEIPFLELNTPRGTVRISSPEGTAFDLVGYAHRCGGLDNVATVLRELAHRLRTRKLARVARLSPTPWAQRLGFLLDTVGADALSGPLAAHIGRLAKEYVPLDVGGREPVRSRSQRWRVNVNHEVELES